MFKVSTKRLVEIIAEQQCTIEQLTAALTAAELTVGALSCEKGLKKFKDRGV